MQLPGAAGSQQLLLTLLPVTSSQTNKKETWRDLATDLHIATHIAIHIATDVATHITTLGDRRATLGNPEQWSIVTPCPQKLRNC